EGCQPLAREGIEQSPCLLVHEAVERAVRRGNPIDRPPASHPRGRPTAEQLAGRLRKPAIDPPAMNNRKGPPDDSSQSTHLTCPGWPCTPPRPRPWARRPGRRPSPSR